MCRPMGRSNVTAKGSNQEALQRLRICNAMNIIIRKKEPQKQLVQFLHAAYFSPIKTVFIKAIENGYFIGWPGLTAELVKRFLSVTVTTELGHIRQEQAGLQ